MRLDYELDAGSGRRARLGLIVLHVDETVEPECGRLLDIDGVAVYCSRIRSGEAATADSLSAMAERLPEAASLLPPAVDFSAIGYACTSGATLIGPERVHALVRHGRPIRGGSGDTAVTDPLSAVVAACRALDVRRPAFVSPYVPEVSAALRGALEQRGVEIAAFGSFEESEERRVARIDGASVLEAVTRVGATPDCDGVFVSCTNLRTLDIIPAAEARLGVPVLASNQVLAWHLLRSAGIDASPGVGGRLFEQA